MHQVFTLAIPMEYTITNNRNSPVWLRQKVKAHLAALTRDAADAAQLHPMGSATVFVCITKRTRGKYDPQNLGDTFKPVVDELVKLGVLDADDHTHVMGPWCYHKGTNKALPDRTMAATLTLAPYSPVPF